MHHDKDSYFFSDPNHIIVSGQSLAATAVGKMSYFTLSNVIGSVEDIEITIESPVNRESVPAQVQEISSGTFKVRIGREEQNFCAVRYTMRGLFLSWSQLSSQA